MRWEQIDDLLKNGGITIVPIAVDTTTRTTSASVLLVSIQIIGSNPNRKGFILYNNSANSAYITYGPTSASSTCSFILPTFTQWVHMYPCSYTGPLSAIRNAGSGTITITEF